MADALIVYGCSRSMNCATLAQLSSTHEICKAAGTYPQTAADHRADSVNLITTSTHPHDVSIERRNLNMIGLAERRHHERRLKEKRKNDARDVVCFGCVCSLG